MVVRQAEARVELTAGRRLCPEVRRVWAELEHRRSGHLSERRQRDLAATFERIRMAQVGSVAILGAAWQSPPNGSVR